MGGFANVDISVADILGSPVLTDDDGNALNAEIRANIGNAVDNKGWGAATPIWGQYGFAARPADKDGTGNAMALVMHQANTKRILAWRDNRFTVKLPVLRPGETMMYGPMGQFARFHEDGSITLLTSDDGTPEGRSIYFQLSPEHGLVYVCPWGKFTFGPNGIHLVHSSGARLDLGAIGGVPGLESLGSYASLQGAMASVLGSVVSVGTDGGANSLAAITELAATLAAVVTALNTISTTPAVVGNPVLTPPQAALVSAALALFTPLAPNIGKPV